MDLVEKIEEKYIHIIMFHLFKETQENINIKKLDHSYKKTDDILRVEIYSK